MEEIMTAQEKRCYTVKDLQEILEISRPTVYELLKRHEFRWIQVGKNYRISRKVLMNGSIRRWKITNLPSKAFEYWRVILGQRR